MKVKTLLGVLVAALTVAGSAKADVFIDFASVGISGGTLSYAGAAAPLVGAGIGIGSVTGDGTPLNSGVTSPVTAGVLSFSTGALSSYDPIEERYTWGAGGFITITGTGPNGSGPTLLTGSVIAAEYSEGLFNIALTAGTDTKDPLLLAFFGYGPAANFQFSGTVLASPLSGGGGGAFTASSANAIVRNRFVPDGSSTLLLLGLASMGIALATRRFA